VGKTIAFVGLTPARKRELLETMPQDWVSFLEPSDFLGGSWKIYKGAVLGDGALHGLDPEAVADAVMDRCFKLLLCPETVNGALLAEWKQAGLTDVVKPRRLSKRLRQIMPFFERPTLEVEDLFDPEDAEQVPPEARHAISILSALRRPTANAWSEALGFDRHRLRRMCLTSFGVPTDRVLWVWLARGVQELRHQGATLEDCSFVFGYSNAGSLHRAFKRRGIDVPPRRRSRQELRARARRTRNRRQATRPTLRR
jgi:AraC-like DNA-binding protein